MRWSGLVLAIGLGLATPVAARADDWTGLYATVAVTSDYRFDGVSSSNRQPTYQALFHYALPGRAYVGVEVVHVRFLDQPPTSTEVDLYGGRRFALGGTELNLGGLVVTYPGQDTHTPPYGFVQGQAEVSRRLGPVTLKGSAAYTPNYCSNTGPAWHLRGAAAYAIRPWLTADVKVGHLSVSRGVDRSHWDAGLTGTWRRWSLDLRYYATSLSRPQCYYTTWCDGGLAATVTYRLTP